ncbi:MAG: histidine phosphatase family protein, partial [Ectopseudomonas oleovorans]
MRRLWLLVLALLPLFSVAADNAD